MEVFHMTQASGWVAAIRLDEEEIYTKEVVMWAFVQNEDGDKEFVGVLENSQHGLAILDRGDNFIGYYQKGTKEAPILKDAKDRDIPFEFDDDEEE